MASLAETWLQQGIEKGILQGIEKGREEGMYLVALNMLKENVDKNLISKVTGLSLDEIDSLNN